MWRCGAAAENDEKWGGRIRTSMLQKFFEANCYGGRYDDGEGGFFEVYRALFARLDDEEEAEEDVNTYHKALPSFGNSRSSHEEVVVFYREWR